MDEVEARNDQIPWELSGKNKELHPGTDYRGCPKRTIQETHAGARQQVVRQGVAKKTLENSQHQQADADQPVDLTWFAERAGEEDSQAVHQHGGNEQHRRPMMHLAEQQAAADVEGQGEGRRIRLGHVQSAKQLVAALVLNLGHGRLEPDAEEDSGQQQNYEGIQRDLTEQEGPVIRKNLAEVGAQQIGDTDALIGPPNRSPRQSEDRASLLLRDLRLDR